MAGEPEVLEKTQKWDPIKDLIQEFKNQRFEINDIMFNTPVEAFV
jgi:hypothetical protein